MTKYALLFILLGIFIPCMLFSQEQTTDEAVVSAQTASDIPGVPDYSNLLLKNSYRSFRNYKWGNRRPAKTVEVFKKLTKVPENKSVLRLE